MSEAYQLLIQGYLKFIESISPSQLSLYQDLACFGQSPKILVVACCDSRLEPFALTQSGPGDLFVVRNVANLVPPYVPMKQIECHGTVAAIQYAVVHLKVTDLVILGHSQCGGIAALMSQTQQQHQIDSFIEDWMKIAYAAKQKVIQTCSAQTSEAEKNELCAHYSIQHSLENLLTYQWIKGPVESNKLALHGWYYDIEHGAVSVLEAGDSEFHGLKKISS
jgi:carbonic anhydrase